ncbi:mechanosensitive ion channel family protein [bacterium]|nr:MAG: mechanosensitive ion channel family protein [bacterium]
MQWLVRASIFWIAVLGLVAASSGQSSLNPLKPNGPTVPSALASPQATMRTFLEGMNDARISSAVDTLDLDEINPLERTSRGPQLAFQLWAILNREVYIDIQEAPPSSKVEPYSLTITDAKTRPVGRVRIDKDSDGAYRFTAETIRDLDRMWALVKTKPVVAGLPDPSPSQFEPTVWMESTLAQSVPGRLFGIAMWKWLFLSVLFAMLALTVGAVQLAIAVLTRLFFRAKKGSEVHKRISRIGSAVGIILTCVMIYRGTPYLGFPGAVTGLVDIATHAIVVLCGVLLAYMAWDAAVHLYVRKFAARSESTESLIAPIVSQLGKAVITFLGVLTLFSTVGINVVGLLTTLGIGGLVLALAAKDSVENLFGSMMFLIEMPFRIGDRIRVGEVDGVVEKIRLRSTQIRTAEDSVVLLPNGAMVTKNVENLGMRRHRRFKTHISVAYDSSSESLSVFIQRIRSILSDRPYVAKDRQLVYLNDFGDNSLDILLDCMLEAETFEEELSQRDEILRGVLRAAEEVGIDLVISSRVTLASV